MAAMDGGNRGDRGAGTTPELIAQIKAIFKSGTRDPFFSLPRLETSVAHLELLSSGEELAYGVRAGASIGELRLYRAGDYSVDLTMDEGCNFDQAGEIIGQISTADLSVSLGGVIVQLLLSKRLLCETETNQFGEFAVQRPTPRDVTLHFLLPSLSTKIEVRVTSQEKDQAG